MVIMYDIRHTRWRKLGSHAGTSQCCVTKGICTKASIQFKKVTTCRAPCLSNTYTKESKAKKFSSYVLTSAKSIDLLEEKAHKKRGTQRKRQEEKGERNKQESLRGEKIT